MWKWSGITIAVLYLQGLASVGESWKSWCRMETCEPTLQTTCSFIWQPPLVSTNSVPASANFTYYLSAKSVGGAILVLFTALSNCSLPLFLSPLSPHCQSTNALTHSTGIAAGTHPITEWKMHCEEIVIYIACDMSTYLETILTSSHIWPPFSDVKADKCMPRDHNFSPTATVIH